MVFLIILSSLLWIAALAALPFRSFYAPALSYLGLLCLSFATKDGYQLVPINGVMLTGWLCMTIVVMLLTLMQPNVVRKDSRGSGYMIAGALAGMAVGLLGFTFAPANLSLLYGMMIIGVIAGIFCGFLLYSRTPDGVILAPGSGHFFRFLLAKGFPVAITVMQIGIAAVLAVALYTPASGL